MKKKIMALFLASLLAIACLPTTALAAPDEHIPWRTDRYSVYRQSSEMIQSNTDQGIRWAAWVISQASSTGNDRGKIRALANFVSSNISYNVTLLTQEFLNPATNTYASLRDLPREYQTRYIPKNDYLSVLVRLADYTHGRIGKPVGICGDYADGLVGLLRDAGYPAYIEIGEISRTARSGERYYNSSGTQRTASGGETMYQRVVENGIYVWRPIKDLHARVQAYVPDEDLWISIDPTYMASASNPSNYFAMSSSTYSNNWQFLHLGSEVMPSAWKDTTPSPTTPNRPNNYTPTQVVTPEKHAPSTLHYEGPSGARQDVPIETIVYGGIRYFWVRDQGMVYRNTAKSFQVFTDNGRLFLYRGSYQPVGSETNWTQNVKPVFDANATVYLFTEVYLDGEYTGINGLYSGGKIFLPLDPIARLIDFNGASMSSYNDGVYHEIYNIDG